MSMIRRLFAVSVLLFSLTALSAQYQALEKSLQETALSFLSYVPQELGDFTLSLISYDTEEVSWSASELAVVQLEFSHEGETHSRTIMFLVDEQVSPEQQVLREVKKILPELAQLFFDLDAQGITLIAQPAAPLLAQAADPELAQPGDLLAVQAADGSLIASLRVDEQDGEFRYLALEWAERSLLTICCSHQGRCRLLPFRWRFQELLSRSHRTIRSTGFLLRISRFTQDCMAASPMMHRHSSSHR